MKANIKFTILSLTISLPVLGSVRSNEKENTLIGYEGGNAIINCPSELCTSCPKYFMKKDNEIVRLDRGIEYTQNGRVTLKHKKRSDSFTVTIHKLTPKDAGIYWCGLDTLGLDFYYTKVNLKVVPKPFPVIPIVTIVGTTSTASTISATTTFITSSHTRHSEHATHLQKDAMSGVLVYIGAGLAVLVSVLALSLVMFYTQKTRGRKSSGKNPTIWSGNTQQAQCHYAEVTTAPDTPSSTHSNVLSQSNHSPDSVDFSPICFDRDEESLQYATVRFTDPPAEGDKQKSTQRHERDKTVIYSTIN